jgi:L-aspartate oxidase
VVTDTVVTDLILSNNACIGATVFDKLSKTHSSIFTSVGVTLASGGLAGIYTHSTNPPGFNALGSSTALAVRANVTVADLEFVQFHPTALCIPGEPCFLLTEALRGEGAKLVTAEGYAFAKKFHPMGELAPRDVVARAVYAQSQISGRVYLDITHRDAQWLRQRFPSIQEKVSQYGLDITKDKLPITPAAHYTCGGIVSDSNGCTSVQNLYVAGEAARTGLHGGNRLASTSLLEAIVWGSRYGQRKD